jgi:hypothetical protein
MIKPFCTGLNLRSASVVRTYGTTLLWPEAGRHSNVAAFLANVERARQLGDWRITVPIAAESPKFTNYETAWFRRTSPLVFPAHATEDRTLGLSGQKERLLHLVKQVKGDWIKVPPMVLVRDTSRANCVTCRQ